jgi:hypothetical protein
MKKDIEEKRRANREALAISNVSKEDLHHQRSGNQGAAAAWRNRANRDADKSDEREA